MTYISDLPCEDTVWLPIMRMEKCYNCHDCVDSCPTDAIDANRQLIDSDKCITYYNEIPGDVFPEWMDKRVHNSIVGCMKCQDCCPGNSLNKDNVKTGVVFTEAETIELLDNKPETYTDLLVAKIEAAGFPPEYTKTGILTRNLTVLMQNIYD